MTLHRSGHKRPGPSDSGTDAPYRLPSQLSASAVLFILLLFREDIFHWVSADRQFPIEINLKKKQKRPF